MMHSVGQPPLASRSEAAGSGLRQPFRRGETPVLATADTGARSSHEQPHPDNRPPSRDPSVDGMVNIGPSSPEDTGARSSNEPPSQEEAQSSLDPESRDEG